MGLARLLSEKSGEKNGIVCRNLVFLKSAISAQMACVRWVSDADSDAGSASWAVVFKVKRNTGKTRKTKITSGFVTCLMTYFTLT